MSKSKIVVIRQLKDAIPVVSFVFDYEDISIDRPDDFDAYAKAKCRTHIEEFIQDHIEFKDATFYVQKITIDHLTKKPISTQSFHINITLDL